MYGYCGSELGVWQYQAALGLAKKKRTNKKVTSVPRRIETTDSLLQILAAATRTQDIQGRFSAWCLPPGLEKSHSGAAVHWEAGPLM